MKEGLPTEDTRSPEGIPDSVKEIIASASKSDRDLFVPRPFSDDECSQETYIAREGHGISASPQAFRLLETVSAFTEESLEQVQRGFRGRVVLDIGPGSGSLHSGYEATQLLGGSAYIGVEPYYYKNLSTAVEAYMQREPEKFEVPFVITSEDALVFLRRLKDNSASVMTSATDSFILRNKKYNEELEREIARVVGDDGAFVAFDSVLTGRGLISNQFELKDGTDYRRLCVGDFKLRVGRNILREDFEQVSGLFEKLSKGATVLLDTIPPDGDYPRAYNFDQLQELSKMDSDSLHFAVRELVEKEIFFEGKYKSGDIGWSASDKYFSYRKFKETARKGN